MPTQPQNWQAIIKQEIAQQMAFNTSLAVPPDQDPQAAAAIQQQLAALHAAEHAAHFHAAAGMNPEKGIKVSQLVQQFEGSSSSGASGSGYPPGDFSHAKVPPAVPKFDFSGLARPEKPPERPPKNKREEISLRKEDYPNTRAFPRPQPRPARRSAAEKRKAITPMNKERQEGFDQMKAARSEPEPKAAPKAAPKAKAQAKLAAQTTSTTAEPRAAPGPNTRAASAPPRSNRKGNRKFTVTDAS